MIKNLLFHQSSVGEELPSSALFDGLEEWGCVWSILFKWD